MQIKIAARHGHLSDAQQQFIREKAEKLLHFFERITLIEVTVDLVLDKLEAQLRRYKEKIQDHRRTPSTGEVAGAPSLEESTEE